MGIYISRIDDAKLYNEALEEAQRLLNISEEIRISVKKVTATTPAKNETKKTFEQSSTSKSNTSGFCIRTGVPIPFDIDKPLSYDSFKAWNKYGDENYPENFCHYSGERSNGEPVLKVQFSRRIGKRQKNNMTYKLFFLLEIIVKHQSPIPSNSYTCLRNIQFF